MSDDHKVEPDLDQDHVSAVHDQDDPNVAQHQSDHQAPGVEEAAYDDGDAEGVYEGQDVEQRVVAYDQRPDDEHQAEEGEQEDEIRPITAGGEAAANGAENGEAMEDQQEEPENVYITEIQDQGVDPNEGENQDDETNIFKLYSQEEIENFRTIFDMFDKDRTGYVNIDDLQTIMKSLGREPDEALELVQDLQLDSDTRLSFEEFLRIMKNLENRLVAGKQEEEGEDNGEEELEPVEGTLEDRNKFGALLPRTGVHFLPDSKVIDFLRLLNDYRKKCCVDLNLTEARKAQLKFDDLKNKEMLRQLQNMRQAQEQELITVESAQRSQFLEFSGAWDNYMSDYEATAYLSLEKLKEKHQLEIQQLHEKLRAEHGNKIQHSRKLMELKDKVRKLTFSKRYEEAEILFLQTKEMERDEGETANDQLEELIEKQEALLRQRQQQALSALLKRIQRDRNEQLKHRQIDSQRLIQRNKNLLLDLLNKQNMETRRTNQFLKVALGTRSPARQKLFKSKFHEMQANDSKLPFSASTIGRDAKTSYNGGRGQLGPLSRGTAAPQGLDQSSGGITHPAAFGAGGRAQTTKDGKRVNKMRQMALGSGASATAIDNQVPLNAAGGVHPDDEFNRQIGSQQQQRVVRA